MNKTIELRDMHDINIEYSEEEACEIEEEFRNDERREISKRMCRKCECEMPFTRIETFRVSAYQHMFSGSRDRGTMSVKVCHYCLRDGWRPFRVRTNHNEVYWKNVFDETNPLLKDNMNRLSKECIEKFEDRHDKNKHNASVTDYGITPKDVGWNNIYEHLREEYGELLESIENGDVDEIMNESRDVMCMALLVNWFAKEHKKERENFEADYLSYSAEDDQRDICYIEYDRKTLK